MGKGFNFSLLGYSCRLFNVGYSKWRTYKNERDGISLIQAGRIVLLMIK